MDKKQLRKHYRQCRDAMVASQRTKRSADLQRLVLSNDRVKRAGSVFVYVSSGSEVQTHGLISALLEQGKAVAVPRVLAKPGAMEAVVVRGLDDLVPGRFGVLEPTTPELLEQTPHVTIVPGLAFTRAGLRLGQGGGYYDRYLAQHLASYKAGLCFTEQLADELPGDAHDIRMDEVIAV